MTLWSYVRSTDISYLRNKTMALFKVNYGCSGQEVFSASSKESLIEYFKNNETYLAFCCHNDERLIRDSIIEVKLNETDSVQYIGGYVE